MGLKEQEMWIEALEGEVERGRRRLEGLRGLCAGVSGEGGGMEVDAGEGT